MASVGHVAVGMACARLIHPERKLTWRAALAFSLLSLWPDADALGFVFGVDYGHSLGHRGATHSIVMSLFVGLLVYVVAKRRGESAVKLGLAAGLVSLSHGLLDTMTFGGGLGCALAWPFSDTRFWAPFRPIPVAPIGLRLLSERGLIVMGYEAILFLPFWLIAFMPRLRRAGEAPKPSERRPNSQSD